MRVTKSFRDYWTDEKAEPRKYNLDKE